MHISSCLFSFKITFYYVCVCVALRVYAFRVQKRVSQRQVVVRCWPWVVGTNSGALQTIQYMEAALKPLLFLSFVNILILPGMIYLPLIPALQRQRQADLRVDSQSDLQNGLRDSQHYKIASVLGPRPPV